MMRQRIWPLVAIGLLLLAGFIIWDFAAHRRVEEFVAISPDIPGAVIPGGSAAELGTFRQVRDTLSRKAMQGDLRITVIWDTPEFFRTLAAAEGAPDIKRHEALYHAYAERFNFHRDLIFTLILDSEVTDLRTIDIRVKSLLRNDKGTSVGPWQWSEARGASSRHLEGVLFFSQRTEAGSPLMGHRIGEHLPGESPPIWLELVLKGLPGGQEAVFRWELPAAVQRTGS